MPIRFPSVAAVALLLLAAAAPARAETVEISVTLSGGNEAPVNASDATGTAVVTLDTNSMEMRWTVTYENLSGPLIAAHIHGPAQPGENAGIVVGFDPIEVSPITGSTVLTEEQAADLLAGLYYVNLHTDAHPGGEVRAQLVAED